MSGLLGQLVLSSWLVRHQLALSAFLSTVVSWYRERGSTAVNTIESFGTLCRAASGFKSDFRYRRFVTSGTVRMFIGTASGVTRSPVLRYLAC